MVVAAWSGIGREQERVEGEKKQPGYLRSVRSRGTGCSAAGHRLQAIGIGHLGSGNEKALRPSESAGELERERCLIHMFCA